MSDTVRFGLVGYGAWGSHHARAIGEAVGAALVAICAGSEASAERARAEHAGIRVYADYHEMLEKESLDAVDIVVPSDLHFEISRAALDAGRHVLLEKPMTLSVAECDALIELARSRDRRLAVGHELRMSSLWGKVKDLVDAGAIGTPLYCLIELWRKPYRLGSGGWRYNADRVGDRILEEPIHFFDLARWYFAGVGEPQSVFARGIGRQPDHPELHDNFSAVLTFPGGSYAVISQSLAGWEHHQTVKLAGTSGAVVARWSGAMDRTFEPAFGLQLLDGDKAVDVPIPKPAGEVYELVEEVQAFVRSVRDGAPVSCSGEDGRWSVAMCLAAAESVK